MSDPLAPNYVNGVGRLVTDRFDFQKHVDGYSFRHDANQIDLSPTVFVDGYAQTTVQSALETLSTYILPPVIPDATTTSKGIIQLSGDISGTATSVEVIKIRGFDVNTLLPSNNDVLTWDSVNQYWTPAAPANTFTPANDLSGSNISQDVVGITGAGGIVSVTADNFNFSETSIPVIDQIDSTTGSGSNLTITAQNGTIAAANGGFIKISGGSAGAGGLKGGVELSLNDQAEPLVQISEVATSRRVVSLAHSSSLTTLDMPSGTGDRVIYIRDAATDPSSAPTDGAILYSSGGKLNVMQSDGTDFIIGSIPNPSIWGSSGQQVYTSKDYVTSLSGNYATAFTYNVTANTSVKLDVIFVGRVPASFGVNEGYSANMAATFIVSAAGTALSSLGGPYTSNISSLGAGWNAPDIGAFVGSTISVRTPYSNTRPVRWLVITQVTIVG